MNEQYLDLFIDESSQHLQEMNAGLMELEQDPNNQAVVQAVFRTAHTLKSMAATMGFERMTALTHEIESGLQAVRNGQRKLDNTVIAALFLCLDVLEAQVQAVVASGSDAGVDVHFALLSLEAVLSETAPTVSTLKTDSPSTTNPASLSTTNPPPDVACVPAAHDAISQPRQTGHWVRIDADKLDGLTKLLTDLVEGSKELAVQTASTRDAEISKRAQYLNQIGTEIQQVLSHLRRVTVQNVFNRFPRMVRDLAKALGKQVDLEVKGADTELDRLVVDEIAEPLVHLIRNALDHGLESVPERVRAGKPETGHLQLAAYCTEGKICVEVADDGRGIDRQAVMSRALQQGLISQLPTASMSDEQVYHLLFLPGFSTVQKVSDISGRGVGLDAVKTKIESLGGSVRVESEIGIGSRFVIELPRQ